MPKIDVEALKARMTGDQVADRLGLSSRGKRYFCPSCQPDGGKTPDLSIKDTGFKCFKCDLSGDLIELVKLVHSCDFVEAVRWIASETGVNVPEIDSKRRKKTKVESVPVRKKARQKPPMALESGILTAFLDRCRPLEGQALAYLTDRGISADVINRLGIRFCGREYADIMTDLTATFGEDKVKASGLKAFWIYFKRQVGFIVIPYYQGGRVVYLKARPPVGKDKAASMDLIRFLNTAGSVPCPFNVDGIADAYRVLICEGESDTLTALTNGYDAIGIPGWNHFKPEWIGFFRGKDVFLVMDSDSAGDDGVAAIAKTFDLAGQAIPKRVELPAGMDLNQYFSKELKT